MSLFRVLRIAVLLTVLVIVAGTQLIARSKISNWNESLWLTIYPVVADDRPETLEYVSRLNIESFREVGEFLTREGRRYGKPIKDPIKLQFAAILHQRPPPLPAEGNRLAVALWSLKMRWWSWRRQREDDLPDADIQIFILYTRAEQGVMLDRSVGMRKGMYTVVNAFASAAMASSNRVVLAHELMHVFGASDKYDPHTGIPRFPGGFADPDRKPLFPQVMAEIMGGRIPMSANGVRMPRSLEHCVVGPETAREVGWQ